MHLKLKLGFPLLSVGVLILVFLGKTISTVHDPIADAAERDQNKHNGRLLMAVAFLSLALGIGLLCWSAWSGDHPKIPQGGSGPSVSRDTTTGSVSNIPVAHHQYWT